jgi:hypothetical protein
MSIYNVMLGYGSFGFNFLRTISTNTADYNLYNDMIANGWNGIKPLNVTVTINSGIAVYASTNASYGFRINNIPTNSRIKIINNGYIVGRGGKGIGRLNDPDQGVPPGNTAAPAFGNGGVAFSTTSACIIDNTNGVIGGGGGAGGAGGTLGGDGSCSWGGGFCGSGGGISGGAAGFGEAGYGYSAYTSAHGWGPGGYNGGQYYQYSSAGTLLEPGAQSSSYGGNAGTSGTLGVNGSMGYATSGYDGPTNPGVAGACTTGNANITWLANGNRYGALN